MPETMQDWAELPYAMTADMIGFLRDIKARGIRKALRGAEMHSEAFSPEKTEKLLEQYRSLMGIGDATYKAADAFDKFVADKAKDFHTFEKTAGPGGMLVHDQLKKDTPEALAVRNALAGVFKPYEAKHTLIKEGPNKGKEVNVGFSAKQAKYTELAGTFQELIKDVPQKHSVRAVIEAMDQLKGEGRKAIVRQQKQELAELDQLFKKPDFIKDLKASLGNPSDADIEVVKKNMKADLATAHTTQLEAFDKSTQDAVKELHSASAKETRALIFLARLNEDKNREMYNLFKEIQASKNGPAQGPAGGVGINIDRNKATITGIKVTDLPTITTMTGKKIKQEDGVFTIEFSKQIWDPKYYLDRGDNVQADMDTLAQAVRACGYDKILMNVKYDNPEVAQIRAQQAFQAALNAGFEPKNIRIKINGTVLKEEDIFKEPSRLQGALAKAEQTREKLAKLESAIDDGPVDQAEVASVKERMHQIVATKKAAPVPDAADDEEEEVDEAEDEIGHHNP